MAVTLPLASTVATDVSELVKVYPLFVAPFGETVTLSFAVLPFSSVRDYSESLIDFTGTFTESAYSSVNVNSSVTFRLKVIVASPLAIAVTSPSCVTEAT